MPLEIRSATEACRLWGDYSAEGALRGVFRTKGGGTASVDDLAAIHAYVETTKGFDLAMPALRWVYVLGHSVATFRLQDAVPSRTILIKVEHEDGKLPVWSQAQAYWPVRYRDLWQPFGGDTPAAAERILYQFEVTLGLRLRYQPFYRPAPFEEQTATEMGEQVNAELQAALNRAALRRGGFGEETRRPSKGQWWKK